MNDLIDTTTRPDMTIPFKTTKRLVAAACVACVAGALAACATKQGYGVGPQAQAELAMRAQTQDPKPDTPGMYVALITRMQAEGLYYASLAHIDAYENTYGASPETTLLRADALRATGQPDASAAAYRRLLGTPLAARGYRGLGLVAGAAGRFGDAAQSLREAAALAPTDAATLSDLGYALLRDGQIGAARFPLMQAIQLDAHNPRIAGNVAVLLVAEGRSGDAQALMQEQQLSAQARAVVANDAQLALDAARVRTAAAAPRLPALAAATPHDVGQDAQDDLPPRLTQRFAR